MISVALLRGDWRKTPSMPSNGSLGTYCPPEHIAAEMDRLVQLHESHRDRAVAPEVEAAWLHHRFTQIHPFQDGNGRVARCLASLVLIQARWFPLSIADQKRDSYVDALRSADKGDLQQLLDLFADAEKTAFVTSLTLLGQVAGEGRDIRTIVAAVADRLTRRRRELNEQRCAVVKGYASELMSLVDEKYVALRRDIELGLRNFPDFRVWINQARNGDENASWYGYQIVEAAKALKYYANRKDFASWIRLRIVVEHDTELLLSFHVPGYEFTGLLACTAVIFRKEDDSSGASVTVDLQTLAESPFYFSYADDSEQLKGRFSTWLERVTGEALVYWQEAP